MEIVKYYATEVNVKACKLLLKKWSLLKELYLVLQIPYNVTILFQSKKLTLSDVYSKWLGMQLHLEACAQKKSYKTGLAQLLFTAFDSRKEKIFSNPLMACALYLHPRYQCEIRKSPEKLDQAKQNLLQIWRRLYVLRENINEAPQDENTSRVSEDSLSFEWDEDAAVMGKIHDTPLRCTSEQVVPTQRQSNDIELIIELFDPDPFTKITSITSYWESMKEAEPQLYELATVIFSIPPTEAQIERDFSHLDHIFTKRRCQLTQSRLEDILLIHLNKDLFYDVNNDSINELYREHMPK